MFSICVLGVWRGVGGNQSVLFYLKTFLYILSETIDDPPFLCYPIISYVSYINKTYRHDITERLLKVALNTINLDNK